MVLSLVGLLAPCVPSCSLFLAGLCVSRLTANTCQLHTLLCSDIPIKLCSLDFKFW